MILENLNKNQIEAVKHFGSPLLILAGAGSGKTRVLTTKIAYLIQNGFVKPNQILAVTFTNKAAEEMRTRVDSLISSANKEITGHVMIKTFHSFGAWIIRSYGELLGYSSENISIYDDGQAREILSSSLNEKLIGRDVRVVLGWINKVKNYGLRPGSDFQVIQGVGYPVDEIYSNYQKRLKSSNAVDFGDLIMLPLVLLQSNQNVLDNIREQFKVILVDEFQDANRAQFKLLRCLYHKNNYLCAVGDDDQSIYGFRGADVKSFLEFPKIFSGTTLIRLEQNYRSTGAILDVASSVVSKNRQRFGKTLWTKEPKGAKPLITYFQDEEKEALYCAGILRKKYKGKTAILYRMNFQSRIFETVFQSKRIPYRIVGSIRFYERQEIKDILAYLTVIHNPRDIVAFQRAAISPRRGIGKKTIQLVVDRSRETRGDLCVAAAILKKESTSRGVKALGGFIDLINELVESVENNSLAEFTRILLDRSGVYKAYLSIDQVENSNKSLNLVELVNATVSYGVGSSALANFLEDIRLSTFEKMNPIREEESETRREFVEPVTLITVHNTKGMEFDRVIITGMEEGIFPATSPAAQEILSEEEEEEERRLFYVAITRARKILEFTSCQSRTAFGFRKERNQSRFLDELDDEFVSVANEENIGIFHKGDGVSHIDYGLGVVNKCWEIEGQRMIRVSFQSGKIANWIEEYANLDRVSGEE